MIRRLNAGLNIPAELLIKEPKGREPPRRAALTDQPGK